jgi:hypothetical protein
MHNLAGHKVAGVCRDSLDAAVAHAADRVSPQDATSWFNHRG